MTNALTLHMSILLKLNHDTYKLYHTMPLSLILGSKYHTKKRILPFFHDISNGIFFKSNVFALPNNKWSEKSERQDEKIAGLLFQSP